MRERMGGEKIWDNIVELNEKNLHCTMASHTHTQKKNLLSTVFTWSVNFSACGPSYNTIQDI